MWDVHVATGRYLSTDFIVSDIKSVEIDELEPTNNKYLIDVVGYVTNVGRITQTRTGSKTLDFYMANCRGDKCKKGNLDCKDGQFWCDSCNSSVDYPVIRYKLELEISDETAEVVVVMFDETARVLLKCSASSILDCEEQDEEASLGLPTALANIVGTSHTLELKSHTYYEHGNYESFTCWKVVTGEDVEEDATSATIVGNDASKASELKRLSKPPAVWICYVREELEDSDAKASFVTDNQPK
ncbi:ATP-dependent DNA helicase PIF1-like protein [Tanacetum coccineum]